jgi:trimeric autotransporter adhesin
MPNTLQIRRGLQSALPTGIAGELLFATDTKRFYISDGSATNLLQGAATLLTTGAIPFSDANGKLTMSASNLYWDNTNARLGIGTTSPTTGLTISKALTTTGNELFNITYTHNSYSSGQIQLGQYFNNTRINFIHGANNTAMYLGGANFTIETQNVGNFILSNGTERMRMVATTGNILIGTTTDAGYKLDVNGTGRFVGNVTINTLSVGKGNNSVTTNTAFGFQALISNGTGSANTSVGYQTLASVVGGNSNTGLGSSALRDVISGGQNTAVGQAALLVTSGNNNTALGFFAGSANTSGTNNIFIGYQTAGISATESNRTWIGNATTTTTWLGGSLLLGTTTDAASSILTVESTTKGFLPPRMTTTQKNAIASPAAGLVVFDVTLGKLCVFSTTWQTITSI